MAQLGCREYLIVDRLHQDIPREDIENLRMVELFRRMPKHRHLSFLWAASRKLAEIAKEERFDLVHDHHYSVTPIHLVSSRVVGSHTQTIITLHNSIVGEFARFKGDLANHLHRLSFIANEWISCRGADGIIVVSDNLRDSIVRYYRVPEQKIVTIPNGVNTRLFYPKETTPAELGLYNCDQLLLFVGNIVRRKGLHYLLEAMSQVLQNSPHTRLVVIGEHYGVGGYSGLVDELIDDLQLKGAVRLVGRKSQRDICTYLSAADLFVFPSTWEGSPKVILEALACACPVVATPLPGIKQIDPQGDFITFCRERDPADLAEKLLYLLDHPLERERRAARGLEEVKGHYTWDHIAGQHIEFYEKLLGK
jgi:glycosyltransferase involved in cell wall biosynthesis